MKRNWTLLVVLLVPALAAEGQVTYCRDIGDNKTYCSGGTVIHRFDNTTVIPNVAPAQPYPPAMPPNPLPAMTMRAFVLTAARAGTGAATALAKAGAAAKA